MWQCSKDVSAVDNNGVIIDFNGNNNTSSFGFKTKISGELLKCLEINCEINLILTWSENCVIVSNDVASQNATFEITGTKLYVPVVTLSTQENSKLLQQLKSGFKRVFS